MQNNWREADSNGLLFGKSAKLVIYRAMQKEAQEQSQASCAFSFLPV
jgi:hypothetical protein